jgi:hypothetical protein
LFDHPNFYFDGLVIDARKLEYEWGDDLSLSPPKQGIPYRVVLLEAQKNALSYIVEDSTMRFDLRTALAEVNDEMK